MMFKVGDKIKVVKPFIQSGVEFLPGRTGIIRKKHSGWFFVEWDGEPHPDFHRGDGTIITENRGFDITFELFDSYLALCEINWRHRLTPVGGKK